jgi:hypothetical protein
MRSNLQCLLLAVALNGAAAASPITFGEHIAPIVFKNCAECHREGQIGPFSLTSYEDVKKHARQIVEVTGERIMPPWHADPGVVEFSNDRSLSKEQIELFSKWKDDGLLPGDLTKLPELPKFPEGWQIGTPDQIATMPEAFTVPAEGRDIYRNFVIPLNLDSDKWVKGIEFKPGDPKVVHHILYYLDTSGKARGYDEKDPAPGYKGMGRSNGEFRYIGGWDVGTQPAQLPYNLRWFIPKGADLVVQIHYHPSGKETTDKSSVGFHYAEEPTARPWSIIPVPPHFGILQGIDIAAGEKEHVEKATFEVPADCEAFSVNAHAHYLGKRMELTATFPDGSTKWLLKTSNWDFNWQEDYAFKQPIKIPAGTKLNVLMTYDNSAENPSNPTHPPKRVLWGPTTTDEMGVITLGVMFDTKEQKEATHQALRVFLVNQLIDRMMEGKQETFAMIQGQVGTEIKTSKMEAMQASRMALVALDKDKNGVLDEEERKPAVAFILQGSFVKSLGAIGFD